MPFQGLQERRNPQNGHTPPQVVRREDDRHLPAHLFLAFEQRVAEPPTSFYRAERVLDYGLPPFVHVAVAQDALAVGDRSLKPELEAEPVPYFSREKAGFSRHGRGGF